LNRVHGVKYATVNVVFRDVGGFRELLFIKRRVNPFDPWSGDVGFPGGGSKESENPVETALRETWEEVGIHPSMLEVLGVYGFEKTSIIPSLRIAIVLSKLRVNDIKLNPAWDEVSEAFWIRLNDVMGPIKIFHPFKGVIVEAYIAGRYIIWGFTKRVLRKILPILKQL